MSSEYVYPVELKDATVDIDSLRAQLEEAQKTLAARDARVAELERDLADADEQYRTAADTIGQCCEDNARRAGAAEAQVSKLGAEAAVMRQALVAITSDFAPEHIDKMGWLSGGTLARSALASGAGQPLLDEMESLRKRIAELEARVQADYHQWAKLHDEAGDLLVERDALKARAEKAEAALAEMTNDRNEVMSRLGGEIEALATSEGHVIALREALTDLRDSPSHPDIHLALDHERAIARCEEVLASPSPQPTHWVPRERVEKLEAEVAAMVPVVEAARNAHDHCPDCMHAHEANNPELRAALAALDAHKGGG